MAALHIAPSPRADDEASPRAALHFVTQVLLFAASAILPIAAIGILIVTPRYKAFFQECDVELPSATLLFMTPGVPLLILAVAAVLFTAFAVVRLTSRRWFGIALAVLNAVLGLFLTLFWLLAMHMPFIPLAHGLE